MATGNIPLQTVSTSTNRTESAATQLAPAQPAPPPTIQRPETLQALENLGNNEGLRAEDFSQEELIEIANAFGEAATLANRGVRITIDSSTQQVVTQVIDRNTDEVVRQIPPQELLDISQRLRTFVGTLLDEQG